MATTYELIDSYTVGSGGASSVTLGSGGTIPNTYTDLLVKISSRFSSAINNINLSLNGSTSNFSRKTLDGDGSSAASYGGNDNFMVSSVSSSNTANTFGNAEVYIPNYTSSNYKSISVDGVAENNATQSYSDLNAMLWSNTAVITSITFTPSSGNFVQYSTFYLYGIKNS